MASKTWWLFASLLFALHAFGQQPKYIVKNRVNQDSVYTAVETPPEFPGGEWQLSKYLMRNIHMSEQVMEEGRFSSFVSFVIDTLGCVSDIKLPDTRSEGAIDKELMRVVKMMPAWHPGRMHGKKVKVLFMLPLRICPQE